MNKANSTYHPFWRLGITAFLAVMLTLAPCSVRNSIEQSLGLEKTTVANKSKSAEVKTASCSTIDIGNEQNFSKPDFLDLDAGLAEFSAVQLIQKFINPKHFSLNSYMGGAGKIPLYILYSSFKYHLFNS